MRWQICEFVFVCCMIQLVSCIENNSTSTTNDNLLSEETKERIRQEVLRDLNTKLKKQQEENFRVDVQRQQHIRQENLPMEQSTLASVIAAAVPVVAAAPVPLVSVATAPAPLISQRPVPQVSRYSFCSVTRKYSDTVLNRASRQKFKHHSVLLTTKLSPKRLCSEKITECQKFVFFQRFLCRRAYSRGSRLEQLSCTNY